MKKLVLAIIALSILDSLVACSGTTTSIEEAYLPTLSLKPNWLTRWLSEPVCKPPCWENITPGKTSFTDTLAIANTISGAEVSYVGDGDIRLESDQDNAYYFALLLSRGDVNIQEVTLISRYTSFQLSEVVVRYGFPDEMLEYIFPGKEFTSRWIALLYYDLGMVITSDLLASDPWNKIVLDPNTSIASINFYAPKLKYYFDKPPQYGVSVSPVIKLNGYGVYHVPENNSP